MMIWSRECGDGFHDRLGALDRRRREPVRPSEGKQICIDPSFSASREKSAS